MEPGYPAPRERAGSPPATLTDRFDRLDTTGGFITLGDTDADVIAFSGVPDRIEIIVELFDAILTPRTIGHQQIETITMRAGQSYTLDLGANSILGRNAVAGSNARVQVIGRWA